MRLPIQTMPHHSLYQTIDFGVVIDYKLYHYTISHSHIPMATQYSHAYLVWLRVDEGVCLGYL